MTRDEAVAEATSIIDQYYDGAIMSDEMANKLYMLAIVASGPTEDAQ